MKYIHKSFSWNDYRIGFYQEPNKWSIEIGIHLPNDKWKEGWLFWIKILAWSVDFEIEYKGE